MVSFVSNEAISLYNSVIYLTNTCCYLKVEFQRYYEDNKIIYAANVYEYASALKNIEEKNHLFFSIHRHVIGTFTVDVNHSSQSIRLGPEGELGMLTAEYQGQSIGRYCISKLLVLAAADVTPFKVLRGRLTLEDSKTPRAKSNRNAFYKKLGLTLKLDSGGHNGFFFCNDSRQLTLGWNGDKLHEIDLPKLLNLYKQTYELEDQINSLESAYECKDESLINSWDENRRLKKWLASLFILILFLVAALLDSLRFIE